MPKSKLDGVKRPRAVESRNTEIAKGPSKDSVCPFDTVKSGIDDDFNDFQGDLLNFEDPVRTMDKITEEFNSGQKTNPIEDEPLVRHSLADPILGDTFQLNIDDDDDDDDLTELK